MALIHTLVPSAATEQLSRVSGRARDLGRRGGCCTQDTLLPVTVTGHSFYSWDLTVSLSTPHNQDGPFLPYNLVGSRPMAAPFQRLLVFDLIPKSFLKFLSHQFLVKFIFQCPISTLKLMKACLRYPILPEFVVETILKHSRLVFRRAEISCHCRW